MAGLQDSVYGLRELSVFRVDGHDSDVYFLTGPYFGTLVSWTTLTAITIVWSTINDMRTYEKRRMTDEKFGSFVIKSCTVTGLWISETKGLIDLKWESITLAPDKQSYQPVEKILNPSSSSLRML